MESHSYHKWSWETSYLPTEKRFVFPLPYSICKSELKDLNWKGEIITLEENVGKMSYDIRITATKQNICRLHKDLKIWPSELQKGSLGPWALVGSVPRLQWVENPQLRLLPIPAIPPVVALQTQLLKRVVCPSLQGETKPVSDVTSEDMFEDSNDYEGKFQTSCDKEKIRLEIKKWKPQKLHTTHYGK